MNLFKTNDYKRYGMIELEKKIWVKSIHSNKIKKIGWANGGVYLINSEIFKNRKFNYGTHCSLEKIIIPKLISCKNIVGALKHNKKFLDIGLPKDYYKSNDFFKV